jgi:hypothetical protein
MMAINSFGNQIFKIKKHKAIETVGFKTPIKINNFDDLQLVVGKAAFMWEVSHLQSLSFRT